MALAPGFRLGPYEVRALLGVGGMGEVYRGHDTRLGRDVALKVISPKLVGDDASRNRFEREARAASVLNHPAIVTVYDVGESDGISWIAMEWVEGRTLRQVLADGPLAIGDALSFARQIAQGLAAAHAKGVVHRDLKPENVMVSPDGRVRILDFGLARQSLPWSTETSLAAAETVPALNATVEGVIVGTVGYMSPEQAAGGVVDWRTDQFSFGLVAYEMLTGRRAFAAGNAIETLWATIRQDPAALKTARGEIPESFAQAITRCLAKNPDSRFASTGALVDALNTIEIDAKPSTAISFPRIQKRDAITIAVIVLILAVGWFLWTLRPGSPGTVVDSLAVLPFENRSTEPASEYLGDELTESLINQIARIESLSVLARATVFQYKGERDLKKIGKALDVRRALTGYVARRGNELTISAELVDTRDGTVLWGETFTQPSSELLTVQDRIVAAVSEKLRPRLSESEKRALGGQGTNNPDAYELFLRGRHLLLSDSEEDDLEARRLYLEALEKDPRFVDARLGVVSTYARSAGNGYAPPKEAWAKAEEHLQKVLALDPDNFSARVSTAARRFMYEWDWQSAERDFPQLSQDPRIFLGNRYHPAAIFFWARGWPDRSVELLDRALRVDPGNLESRIMLADFLAHAGRLGDAVMYYRAIAEIAPGDSRPIFGLAEMLVRQGDVPGGIAALTKAYQLTGEDEGVRALANARTERDYDGVLGKMAASRAAMLEDLRKERYVSPLELARYYAQAAAAEKAFQYLELALAERSPMVVLLKVDPAWEHIRTDRRFAAIVRRAGIP